ncbi:13142_t:CDS:2 [Funneliformis geosporum]|uniref:6588_t:CDS:1 n=1 Tax=Funneliformis geosporum TaxID=1117311 RepID=A0A9W4SA34_9GLOM|nr:6588_t:CDS:2 [Funneliformis geosporum]CAI2162552.1 13142_t:CDS:2 [Funneliformis geosporum]
MRSSNVFYVLVLILSFIKKSYPMLKLYNKYDEEFASFRNVDLPVTNSYTQVTGNLFIASFQNNQMKQDPCIIREIPNEVDILVIPFLQALNLGCKSYANILQSNSWTNTSNSISNYDEADNKDSSPIIGQTTDTATIIPPTLNDTTSVTNDQEQHQISPSSIPTISNSNAYSNDEIQKSELVNNTPKLVIFSSSHNGIPGIKEQYKGDIKILRTATLIITLINCDDIDDLIKIANEVTYVKVTANEGPWIEFMKSSFVLLELDPGDIYQDKLEINTKVIFYCLKRYLVEGSYTILYMSWVIVAGNICKEKMYKPLLFIETSKLFKAVPPISVSTFTLCFILRLVYKDKSMLPSIIILLKVLFIIESIALGLIGLGFLVFGILIIFALRRIRSIQIKILLMTFFIVFSIAIYIRSNNLEFLVITVKNFQVDQFACSIISIFTCIIMIFTLEDNYIGRYLPSNVEVHQDVTEMNIIEEGSDQDRIIDN